MIIFMALYNNRIIILVEPSTRHIGKYTVFRTSGMMGFDLGFAGMAGEFFNQLAMEMF